MDVLSALVIGGVSFLGGEGKVTKAVGGILLITMLTNGLTLAGVNRICTDGNYRFCIPAGCCS